MGSGDDSTKASNAEQFGTGGARRPGEHDPGGTNSKKIEADSPPGSGIEASAAGLTGTTPKVDAVVPSTARA